MARTHNKGKAFARVMRPFPILGIALLVLLARQAWAADICICEHRGEVQTEACHCKHHGGSSPAAQAEPGTHTHAALMGLDQAAQSQHAGMRHRRSAPISNSGMSLKAAATREASDKPSECSPQCCASPAEIKKSIPSLLTQGAFLVKDNPPSFHVGRLTASLLERVTPNVHPSRQLYIALSCLLI